MNATPPPTYPQYAELWAEAQRRARGPIEPGLVDRAQKVVWNHDSDWAISVLGHAYQGVRWLTVAEVHLLVLADEHGITPPLPDWVVQARKQIAATHALLLLRDARAEAERLTRRRAGEERDAAAWAEVKATVADGVELKVYQNTNARPRRGYSHHLGHTVPTADVFSPARRHQAGRALCEAETRSRPLSLRPATDDTPVTCERCLHWAALVRA